MPTAAESHSAGTAQRKRSYLLEKRDGTRVRCYVPGHFTVGQAKNTMAQGAGYDPVMGEGMSVRLAVESDSGRRLLTDEMQFRDLEEGATLKLIPSLSPAR